MRTLIAALLLLALGALSACGAATSTTRRAPNCEGCHLQLQ